MNNFFNKIVRLFCLCVFLFGHSSADAQNKELPVDINPYFGPVGKQPVVPNAAGFIQRWLLLEPISMPVKSNVVFTDSYLKEQLNQSVKQDDTSVVKHLRPNHRVEHQHLVDWRPLEFDLYSLLRSQPVVLMDDDAPAA